MVTDVERLVVIIEANQRKFNSQLNQMNRSAAKNANGIEKNFERMNRNITRSTGVASRAIANLGAQVLAGLSAREIVAYADAWTTAENKIAAASQVAGRAARDLGGINDIATETRAGITETADLYAKLLRATKDVAKSELEVARATAIVNKGFKAGGAAASEQAAGILQLGQGLSSGVLQGDELRSLRENAPLIAQAIADEFETTIGGLKELGAQGELTAARVFQGILNGQANIEAAFVKTNTTIGESFTLFRNALVEYVGTSETVDAASDKLAGALSALAGNLDLVVAAGVALGARFIGPVILGQLLRAIPAIRAASVALVGLGAGAKVAAGSLGLVRASLALFGGPIGLVITALTALPLVLADSVDRVDNLERAGNSAIQSLDNYASASKRAATEQEKLGGKVSAATQQILNQTRANLQDSFRQLRDEYAELKSDLEDGIIFNSDATSLGQRLATAGASNPFLADIGAQLKLIGDGSGDVAEVTFEMERLAGVGDEAVLKVREFNVAVRDSAGVDFSTAVSGLVNMATQIGGFAQELAAIENAQGLDQQVIASRALATALENAAQAGGALRSENAKAVRNQVKAAAAAKTAVEGVTAALEGNIEAALDLVQPIDDSKDAASELSTTAAGIDFGNAISSAQRLAKQLGISVGLAQQLARVQAGGAAKDTNNNGLDALDPRNPNNTRPIFEGETGTVSPFDPSRNKATKVKKPGGGGSGGTKDAISDVQQFTETLQSSEAELRRQIESIGLTTPELAGLRAEYELVDMAKKNGIDLNKRLAGSGKTVSETIKEHAASVAALSAEYEQGKLSQDRFESGIDDLASGLADVAFEGASLRDSLRDVFNGIARDIFKSGIRSALTQVLTPTKTGGGGGFFGKLIGSVLGFEKGGYTGDGGKSDPAGVVHKGEYVFDKAATSRIGVDNLEKIRSGNLPGYMTGGLVGSVPSVGSRAAPTGENRQDGLMTLRLITDDSVTIQQVGQIAQGVAIEVVKQTAPQVIAENNNRFG